MEELEKKEENREERAEKTAPGRQSPLLMLAFTALFAALTAVGAFIRIPTPWLAFTMQLLFVLMAGLLLGPLYGALSQLVYLLLGLIGLPIFTFGGCFSGIFQPSFGFLLGFIPAAAVTGAIARNSRNILRAFLACLAGLLMTYLVGIPYMWLILNYYIKASYSFGALLMAYMLPYLPFDALKIAIVLLSFQPLRSVIDKTLGRA
ncbi:MAG: biotin transporter BioY [Lachnospiraceae bacterium]|nr:biotin transporter BioY [Lachnospiraceae bacterium]